MKTANNIGTEEMNLDLANPAELIESIPEIKNCWFYRGRLHIATDILDVELVKQCLNGKFFKFDQLKRTAVLRSYAITSEAAVKQFESWNNRKARASVFRKKFGERFADVYPSPISQQYSYLLNSASHCKNDFIPEYYSVIDYDRQCEIEDENDDFNPHDLSVPEGYVGHYYRDEF